MMSLYWYAHRKNASKRDYVKEAIEKASDKTGGSPEYGISDGAHNLVGGFKDTSIGPSS